MRRPEGSALMTWHSHLKTQTPMWNCSFYLLTCWAERAGNPAPTHPSPQPRPGSPLLGKVQAPVPPLTHCVDLGQINPLLGLSFFLNKVRLTTLPCPPVLWGVNESIESRLNNYWGGLKLFLICELEEVLHPRSASHLCPLLAGRLGAHFVASVS